MKREANRALNSVRERRGVPIRHKRFDARLAAAAVGAVAPLSCLLMAIPSQAATDTWTAGDSSSSWTDPLNWFGDSVPVSGDDVIIPNQPFQPRLSVGFNFNSLLIEPFALLTINENLSLGTSPNGPGPISNINVNSLTIDGGAIDLNNNHMIVNYAPGTQATVDATIGSYLTAGHNSANSGSIFSSDASASYTVGYADGADGVVVAQTSNHEQGLPSGEIEIAYTLYGDANLDGVVSGEDFTILAAHFKPGPMTWDEGDFDYDGAVTGTDFTELVTSLDRAATAAAVELPSGDLAVDGLMADVPEPAIGSMLLIAGTGMLMRRGRKQLE